MTTDTGERPYLDTEIDPDPFTIGLGVFGAMVSGVGFLEMKRQTRRDDERERDRFRAAWFTARRAVLSFQALLDEFATYMAEDGFGSRSFRLGAVRLVLTIRRAQDMMRMHDRALEVARDLSKSLDVLSEHLPARYAPAVEEVVTTFEGIGTMPERFADLVPKGQAAVAAYTALLDAIAKTEGFEVEVASIDTARSRRGRGSRRT